MAVHGATDGGEEQAKCFGLTEEEKARLMAAAKGFAKEAMEAMMPDASHDWAHVERVRSLALRIAAKEGVTAEFPATLLHFHRRHMSAPELVQVVAKESLLLIELAALMHDVNDHKYLKNNSGPTSQDPITDFFLGFDFPNMEQLADRVKSIVARVGFKDELAYQGEIELNIETMCVQDADRLDAIGAIGIARCFTFGGARKRPLYVDGESYPSLEGPPPSKKQYMEKSGSRSTIYHFFEKLLRLKGMIKTESAKQIADSRHQCMQSFVDDFLHELQECQ